MTGRFVGNTVGRLGDFVDMEVSVLVVTGVSGSGVGYWGSFRSDWIEVWGGYMCGQQKLHCGSDCVVVVQVMHEVWAVKPHLHLCAFLNIEVSDTCVDKDEGSVHISQAPRSKCCACVWLCGHACFVSWGSV